MDEDEDDAALVDEVAVEFIERHGAGALSHVLLQESMSRAAGDELSADAWRDIANAIAEKRRAPNGKSSSPHSC